MVLGHVTPLLPKFVERLTTLGLHREKTAQNMMSKVNKAYFRSGHGIIID